MKIETNSENVSDLYHKLKYGRLIIPDYQREFCWSLEKQELFLDSLHKEIPIGLIQVRKIWKDRAEHYEIIDGLHRLKMLFKILTGKGVYFNVEKAIFTLNDNDFDYSKIEGDDVSPIYKIFDRLDTEEKMDIQLDHNIEYKKVYFIKIPMIYYSGSDDEIKIAFDRINQEGVAITPKFNLVSESKILTL